MATISELLEALRNPGEEGVPDSIYDDIASTYNQDIEIRDAKINELDQGVQEREATISALKSANYDLLMASSGSADEEESADDTDDDAEPAGIDDLFND